MKKYIGTKQIEAEPMKMGEADEKCLIAVGEMCIRDRYIVDYWTCIA